MRRSPRQSITWTAVAATVAAATVAAAVVSALMLAVNEQGSLARMGWEGRAMIRLGPSKKAALGGTDAAASTDTGRDEQNRRGMLQH